MNVEGWNVKPAGELMEPEGRERLAQRCETLADECEGIAKSHALQEIDWLNRAAKLRARAAQLRKGSPHA